ncbi:MAG: glycosyltransferase, partial [Methanosarcinaceae archaeon]
MEDNNYLDNQIRLKNNIVNNNIYLDSFPVQIHFLMNDKCNAKCIMCGGDYFNSKSGRRITFEKFKKMASNIKFELCRGIVLAGAGDPLLNQDLIPIVQFIKSKYPHICLSLTTNGIGLTEKLSKAFLEHNVDVINISINSATRNTYKRIMQVDCFNRVCENINKFIWLRQEYGRSTKVQFSSAINMLNINELPGMVELGKDIGIDSINIMYCRFYPDRIRHLNVEDTRKRLDNEDSLFFHQELSDQMVGKAKTMAMQYNIGFSHEPLFKQNIPPQPCIWPAMEIMVGFDGEVYPCGGAEIHFKDKVEKGIYNFGNVLNEPVESFWNNEQYIALRRSSKHGDMCIMPECRCCANALSHRDISAHIMDWDKKIFGTGKSVTNTPLVSVIVPTYNRPEMLTEAINSIRGQTYKNFEIVVVNDAGVSTENVVSKLNKDKNITCVVHAENRGLAAARNTGIKIARGKYIALLDDDDLFYPDHLETAMQYIGDDSPVIYTNAVRAVYEKASDSYSLVGKKVPYSIDFSRDKLLIGNISPVNCFVFEKKPAIDAGLFDETLTTLEDWEFWIRLSSLCRFKHIPRETVQVNWRTDGTTMTSSRGSEFKKNRDRIYKRYQDEINKIADRDAIVNEFKQIWEQDGKEAQPLVSIIILSHNQLEYTKKCIESIFRHTKESFELIMVDNGSTDGTVEYLETEVGSRKSEVESRRSEGRIKIIKNKENLGFAAGNNQGIAVAMGDYILLMNNDIVVTPNWLDSMISCAERNPRIGIVGPMSNYVSGPQLVKDVTYNITDLDGLDDFAAEFSRKYTGKAKRFLRVVGFCMLIKRAVIDRIGGMDNSYGLGNFEDDDFSLRATLAGFESWMAEDCFIHHFGSRTFIGAQIDYQESLTKNWEIFKNKWGLPTDLPLGSNYNLAQILKEGFVREKHFCPLDQGYSLETGPKDVSSILPDAVSLKEVYQKVQRLVDDGKQEEAIGGLERLLEMHPGFAIAHNDLGVLYYERGDKDKALKHYKQAAELNPDNITFQKNLADFYYVELGRVEDALRIYVKVLAANPEDVEVLLVTGHISVSLCKFDDAKLFYSRALEIEPCNEDARQNLHRLENIEQADQIVKSSEDIYQDVLRLVDDGRHEEAIGGLEGLLEMHPDFAIAHNDLGVLYYERGDKDKALKHYKQAAEL